MNNKLDKIKGCLVGLAVGDALGVHLEFTKPGSFTPITDYTEGNPYDIPIGYWTDDTSMALCMAQSLIEKKTFDAEDIMKKFCQWQRKGYMSSTDSCFDIGNTTRNALMEYWRDPSKGPYRGLTDVMSAGNGSIMRLAPIPMFFHNDIEHAVFYAGESSRITHGYIECVDACKFLSGHIWLNLNVDNLGYPLDKNIDKYAYMELCNGIDSIRLGNGDFEIKGSGYVVDSLRASVWAAWSSTSFEEVVLKAVNLGDDADTTGAVTGQIAGSLYGYDAIPQKWKDGLRHHDMIVEMAEKIYEITNEQRP